MNVYAGSSYTVFALFDTTQISAGSSISLRLMNYTAGGEITRMTIGPGSNSGIGARKSFIVTMPSGCSQVFLLVQVAGTSAEAGKSMYVAQFQIEKGTLATSYKPNLSNHVATEFNHGAMSTGVKATLDVNGPLSRSR